MERLNRHLQMIILLIAGILSAESAGAESLYVFYPSFLSAATVQKQLAKACPQIEILVFGRFKDFEDSVLKNMPDAILTKPAVMGQMGGYAARVSGSRGGSTEENYVFLSVEKKTDPAALADKTLGVFDILGKKGMDMFVGKFISPIPKLRRVSKMEDLLQMLTFNMADAILIPDVYVRYYKEISKLNFTVTPFPGMRDGILALGVKQGMEAPLTVNSLTSLNKTYMALLEVEQWK